MTQTNVAKRVHIDQSSIAKFEREQLDLSEEVLLKLADIYEINKDYVKKKSEYPFIPGHFYKLYTSGRSVKKLDFLFALPFLSVYFDAVTIIPDLSAITKFFRVRVLSSSVYAIVLKDHLGTIFLLREKNPRSFIKASKYLMDELFPIMDQIPIEEAGKFSFRVENLDYNLPKPFSDKELLEKIENWTVKKEDIERLFYKRDTEDDNVMRLSKKEKELILKLRGEKIDPTSLLKKL